MPTKLIIPPWTKHTQWHWSKWIEHEGEDHQLNYWPTKRTFQWRGKVRVGNVNAFIDRIMSGESMDEKHLGEWPLKRPFGR